MKPTFTFLGLCLFVCLCLVYIKEFGYEEFTKWFMNQALNYAALAAGAGVFIDVIRGMRE